MEIYCVAQSSEPYLSIYKLVNYEGFQWEWMCKEGSIRHWELNISHLFTPKRIFKECGYRGHRKLIPFQEGDLDE